MTPYMKTVFEVHPKLTNFSLPLDSKTQALVALKQWESADRIWSRLCSVKLIVMPVKDWFEFCDEQVCKGHATFTLEDNTLEMPDRIYTLISSHLNYTDLP